MLSNTILGWRRRPILTAGAMNRSNTMVCSWSARSSRREGKVTQADFRTTAFVPEAECGSSFAATNPSATGQMITAGA